MDVGRGSVQGNSGPIADIFCQQNQQESQQFEPADVNNNADKPKHTAGGFGFRRVPPQRAMRNSGDGWNESEKSASSPAIKSDSGGSVANFAPHRSGYATAKETYENVGGVGCYNKPQNPFNQQNSMANFEHASPENNGWSTTIEKRMPPKPSNTFGICQGEEGRISQPNPVVSGGHPKEQTTDNQSKPSGGFSNGTGWDNEHDGLGNQEGGFPLNNAAKPPNSFVCGDRPRDSDRGWLNSDGGDVAQQGRQRPPNNNYVPEVCDLDDLYKEDLECAEKYRQVADDDDDVHVSGHHVSAEVIENWNDAHFDERLIKNVVERSKYVRPRRIQAYVIPYILKRWDVQGHAETGSGKTAAFMLPIIQAVINLERGGSLKERGAPAPYAIIVEPTRELCGQVYEQGRKLANETGVSVAKAYGQYCMRENLHELQRGCDILCATPGRLKHLICCRLVLVSNVKYLVLDEADMLLEHNFVDDIRDVLNFDGFPNKEERQSMLFSATFRPEIQHLSATVLRDDYVMVSNRKYVATNAKVMQNFIKVSGDQKKQALLELLKCDFEEAKKKDSENPVFRRTLVFVRTKRDADLVSLFLCQKGIKATTINGLGFLYQFYVEKRDRTQDLREIALRDFRTNRVSVLVSTDVCARGIDIKELDHVVNMDLPNEAVTYVHRIGRTGRLKNGVATSFFDECNSNDRAIAKNLVEFLKNVGQDVPQFLLDASDSTVDRGFRPTADTDMTESMSQPLGNATVGDDDYASVW